MSERIGLLQPVAAGCCFIRNLGKLPMIYLLDVNALVALGFINHEFHGRIAAWVQSQDSLHRVSCSITELGFVRVLARAPAYGFTVTQARTLLLRLKQARSSPLAFIPDTHDVSHMTAWVRHQSR